MRGVLALAAMCLAWACAPSAQALNCLPIVGCVCSVGASDIVFDDFSPLPGDVQTATGSIDIECFGVLALGGGVSVEVFQGQWGDYAMRKLRSAEGETIDYNIYTTNAYAQVWGAGGQAVVINAGIILLQTWRVQRDMFARIQANPKTKPGFYADEVVVRVTW